MSVTVTRDPRGARIVVTAPGPPGVQGPEGKQGPVGPMPVVGTAAARDVPAQGDATSAQVVLGSDTRLTDARTPRAHTHPVAEVTGLDTALAGKAASVHTHDVDDVDALPALLNALAEGIDGCAPASHTHAMGHVVGLGDALAGKAASKHAHVAAEVTDLGSAAKCSAPAAGQDAAAAEVVLGRDTRLTNSRTPTAHAATHSPGGADPLPELARIGNRLPTGQAQCTSLADAVVYGSQAVEPGGNLAWTIVAGSSGYGSVWWGGSSSAPNRCWGVAPGPTTFQFRAAATAATQTAASYVRWYGVDQQPIGGTTTLALAVALGPTPVDIGGTLVAPEGAAYATVRLQIAVASEQQIVRISRVGVWLGAGGDWRPPGEPIPGLGWQRRSPAGGVDWVLERWDGTQWVLIDGDTGPRAVGASGRAHRRGQMVTWTATDVVAPVGWRDGYSTGQKCYMTPDPWPTGALPGVPA